MKKKVDVIESKGITEVKVFTANGKPTIHELIYDSVARNYYFVDNHGVGRPYRYGQDAVLPTLNDGNTVTKAQRLGEQRAKSKRAHTINRGVIRMNTIRRTKTTL